MSDGDYGMECVIKGLGSAVNDAVKRALADQDIPTDAYVEEMIAAAIDDYDCDIDTKIERWADYNITDYIRDYFDSERQEVGELADDVNKLGGAMDTFAERMDSATWQIADLHEQIDYLHNRIAELSTPWYTKMWNCAVSAWSSAYSYVKGIF
jgi:hypothetical protein